MKKWLSAFAVLFLFSCNEINVQKVSSEEIYSAEAKRINWREVDEYPAFEECTDLTNKSASKSCFENKVAAYINSQFGKNDMEVSEDIKDTLMLYLSISESGKPAIDSLEVDSLVTSQLPDLKLWLQQSVDSLPKIYPASKRGIPVSTVFKLPIVITAE